MTKKNAESFDFIRLRQKGLFIFSILILGFLGFRYWAIIQKPTLPEKMSASPGITVELAGAGPRPGLLHYAQPPTVPQILRDGGWLLTDQALSAAQEKGPLIRDATLLVSSEKNGKAFIQQKPLSAKALWILGRPLPLNRATVEDLDRLPGIGPGLALRIVEYRQVIGNYSTLDQLMEVNGIKEKTFEKIKGYLTL
ncbi:MAG: helix-hairpin-helix domain-containing protein [Deltaproteobacteria bacterium]|nr:helix-hairpin-helix domain-containing protein [Deltaproteobacteria bacterium]